MVDELELRREILIELRDYLELCAIPADALRYDEDVGQWVVGCFKVGSTLIKAKRIIPEYL